MADKYDERARELMPDCKCRGAQFYTCTLCDGTRERRCDRDDLAAALRAAAEEEREAIRQHILDRLNRVSKHSCPQYESCIYCEAARELDSMEDDIRARGEVGK